MAGTLRYAELAASAGNAAASGAVGVLAVGGGSAMDTAKAIALLSQSGGKPSDYVDGLRAYTKMAPLICVPTTAGTGSEVTRSAVITEHTTHRKMTLKHAMLRPQLAVLDPELTLTVPLHVTAATGVDALVHAIEGATCKVATPIARAFGYQAMREIVQALPQAYANPNDVTARARMLQASLLAGLCFGSTDVAAVHCLAEALGGLYDTPHGVANAVFLPHVLRYNVAADLTLHADIARVMGFAASSHNDDEACGFLIKSITDFTSNLNIPSLRDLPNVRPTDFKQLAEMASVNNSTASNIRAIDYDAYLRLLYEAYGN